jgi:hypothetical protein
MRRTLVAGALFGGLFLGAKAIAASPWPPTSGSQDAKIYLIIQKVTEHIALIATLQTQVAGLQAQINVLDGRVDALEIENDAQQVEIDALQTENANQQTEIDDLQTENANQQTEIDDLQTENANQQTEIDDLQTENANQQTEIDDLDTRVTALEAGGWRRLGGVGFTFVQTTSNTLVPIASVLIPANTITQSILITATIDQSSFNAVGSTAEIETELQINGIARDTQSWTQTQSGVFVVTQSHSTFATGYVPNGAEMAADMTITVLGRSPDGRTKNFNLHGIHVWGR